MTSGAHNGLLVFVQLSLSSHPGEHSTNFYTGRLCPEVQPLTLLYTIFHEKGAPYTFY